METDARDTREKGSAKASPLSPQGKGTGVASPLSPLPQPGEGLNSGSHTQGAGAETGADKTTQGKATVGSMGTGGSMGGGAKDGMPDGAKDGMPGGAKDGMPGEAKAEDKERNVVRDRSGKAVLGIDGKPITYGEGGQLTNVQLYELLNQRQELTPEEKKREKRQKMFAAIGDGISALANLYFTTKGAPSMYTGKQTQSQKEAAYWEKMRQDRENERQRYVDGYLKALQADSLAAIRKQNAAIRKQNADTQQAAKEAEAERKKAETKRKDELAEAQGEVFKARAAKDAAATAMSEKTLEYMNTYGWPLKQAKAQAEIDLLKARKTQAYAAADKATASGKYYGTFNGVAYRTKADYDKAVVDYARGNKIPLTYDKASTDKYGRRNTTQTNRSIPGLAAAGEKDYKAKQAAKAKAKAAASGKNVVGSMGTGGSRGGAKGAAAPAAKTNAPAKKTYTHTKGLGL